MHVYIVRQIFEARLSYIRSWRQTNKKPKIHKWLKTTDSIMAWMFLLLLKTGSCYEAHTGLQLLQSSSEASQALGDKQAITVPRRFGSHTSAEGVVCSCAALVQWWTLRSARHWSMPWKEAAGISHSFQCFSAAGQHEVISFATCHDSLPHRSPKSITNPMLKDLHSQS